MMKCTCTTGASIHVEVSEQARRSRDLDTYIQTSFSLAKRVCKILLLGGGESGKSTFLKQIRILRMNGFTEADFVYYRQLVHLNIFECMNTLLEQMNRMKIPMERPTNQQGANMLRLCYVTQRSSTASDNAETMFPMLRDLWRDAGVQKCFERREQFHLLESTKYFMDNLERLCSVEYKPTVDDILRTRAETQGIIEVDFRYRDLSFKMVDVSGQRSKRRKWIHCFDDVSSILFISSLSEYNETLREDPKIFRMRDSLMLFNAITTNPLFKETKVILFLNKKDIFEEKIANTRIPLSKYFRDYTGAPKDSEAAKEFIRAKFESKAKGKEVYSHFTNATDTNNIDRVFEAAIDIILHKNIVGVGLQ